MEERNEILTLVDEEGKEHLFSIVDLIVVEEKEYAILLPFEEVEETDGSADEAVIFRVIQDEQGQVLMVVEDDQEWETVATAWEERNGEAEEEMDIED